MAIKSQLFIKTLAQNCSGVKFDGFHAPQKAKTYDFVSGTGKKGQFEITTFRDKNGSMIKRVSKYLDDAGNKTLTITNYNQSNNMTYKTTAVNGEVKEHVFDVMDFCPEGNYLTIFRNKLLKKGNDTRDIHLFGLYRKNTPPREISYETKWDGNAPKIQYKNIKNKLKCEGLEYLPLVGSESAMPRYKHTALIQMKKYGLKGIAKEPLAVDTCEINPGFKTFSQANDKMGFYAPGFTEIKPPSGNVFISKEVKASDEIIETLAHEYTHVYQLSQAYRLEEQSKEFTRLNEADKNILKKFYPDVYNFLSKSIAKGIIKKKGSEDWEYRYWKFIAKKLKKENYKHINSLTSHDLHPVEVGAIREGKKEVKKFNDLFDAIIALLHKD